MAADQHRWRYALFLCLVVLIAAGGLGLMAQRLRSYHKPDVAAGKVLWNQGCASCHGPTGKGAPPSQTEFKRPDTFPDFTACDQTTPETNQMWKAVIVHGGPGLGYSHIMPSFDKQLTSEQMDDLIGYMRSLCSPHWPRGELNLPRAIVTEKAFPEKEFVISTTANASGAPGFETHAIHEQAFGKKGQLEIDVPMVNQDIDHKWNNHIGDMTIGWKQVMFANLHTGSILALQGGIIPPTGSKKLGGNGTTVFEPFLAFDQLFPTNTWVQFQMGADLPRHPNVTPQSLYYHTAIGQTWASDHELGRQYSPMVEFLADRDLEDGAKTNWDVMPEMQFVLSKRQHVRANLGVRVPFTETEGRTPSVNFYILWDWADGHFWNGWK